MAIGLFRRAIITGIAITGIAITGIAITGIAITGIAITGVAVTRITIARIGVNANILNALKAVQALASVAIAEKFSRSTLRAVV